jgi:phenylalanyl-tRNA synthetase beta chain
MCTQRYTQVSSSLSLISKTAQIRPFVVSAILRDFEFNKSRYDGFIELQDKLHNNICRKRTLVAIGTHDLDTIQGPFRYEAKTPETIHFVPLNQKKSMNGNELMEFYQVYIYIKGYISNIRVTINSASFSTLSKTNLDTPSCTTLKIESFLFRP